MRSARTQKTRVKERSVIERDTPARKAEFLLAYALDDADYHKARD
jgi:hypothetical protein